MKHDQSDDKRGEYLKFAAVMALILLATAAFYTSSDTTGVEEFLRWFMGVFSIVFASFKFVGYKMFVVMFRTYDVVAKKLSWYSNLFPFLQLGLGSLFIFDWLPDWRNYLMLIFAGISSIGVINEVYKRRSGQIHCACLGNVIKLPLSTVSVIEDIGMFLLALAMLIVV